MQRKEKGYYDIDIDIDETLLKMGLVDDIFYLRDLKQRKMFLTANIDQFSIGDITKHIMQYNAEDKGVLVEQRQPILLYVASNGGDVDAGFELIVYVRNNIEVKNSKPIGHLPGSYNEKLLPFAMPLADHLGGVDGLELMIGHGKIEIVHLGFIRGRDIKNSIIICSEAENMTKEHIQLLLGRVGEGSSLWINGDFKQCDADVFRENSGLMTAVNKLKGHPRFGYVKLLKTERSETAAMADLLD